MSEVTIKAIFTITFLEIFTFWSLWFLSFIMGNVVAFFRVLGLVDIFLLRMWRFFIYWRIVLRIGTYYYSMSIFAIISMFAGTFNEMFADCVGIRFVNFIYIWFNRIRAMIFNTIIWWFIKVLISVTTTILTPWFGSTIDASSILQSCSRLLALFAHSCFHEMSCNKNK